MISERPLVAGVAAAEKHRFGKEGQGVIMLLAGLGVEGDAHCGAHVQHLYDRAKNPGRPNLRQVHLIQKELLDELKTMGFAVMHGELGENITTQKIELLQLATGALLRLGPKALVQITGLRQPCVKIARFKKGLLQAVTEKRDGHTFMRAAVMAIVLATGEVSVGDPIQIVSSAGSVREALRPV